MQQGLLVRLRPAGPWRYGPSDGAFDRVDMLYRSDRLFSAVTIAMGQLGHLDAWLEETARNENPAVAFTSLFPFQGDTLFVVPPATLWPPPSSLVNSPSPVFLTKVRWRAAQFVPLSLVDSLMTGQSVLADQWIPDPESGCLLRRDRPSSSPFRTIARAFSPVDRVKLTSADAEPHACVEFEAGSGLWTVARFADDAANETWSRPLQAAFRLLADTGFGGGRSKGWGQVQAADFETGTWPSLIMPKLGRATRNSAPEGHTSRSYWLLSLYSPAAQDRVNWSAGQYELTARNGRVNGGSGALKKSVRMVTEGCVLESEIEPVGAAIDVAPAGFAHPVYRSGIVLSLLIPPPKAISDDRRAIEEIVPPELEATPFPMPVVDSPVLTPEPAQPEPTTNDPVELPKPGKMPEPVPQPSPAVDPDTAPDSRPELPHEPHPKHVPEIAPEIEPKQAPEITPAPAFEPHPEFTPSLLPEKLPEVSPQPEPELPHSSLPEIMPQPAPEMIPDTEPKHAPEMMPEPAFEPHPEVTPSSVPDVAPEISPAVPSEMPHGAPPEVTALHPPSSSSFETGRHEPVIEIIPEDISTSKSSTEIQTTNLHQDGYEI